MHRMISWHSMNVRTRYAWQDVLVGTTLVTVATLFVALTF